MFLKIMIVNFVQSKLIFKYNKKLTDIEIFIIFNISMGKKIENLNGINAIELKNHIVKIKSFDNNNIGKMIYKIDEKNKQTKIFDKKFVKINRNRAKIILNNKQFNLIEKIKSEKEKIKFVVKIKFLENIIDINCMFKRCKMLSLVKNFEKFNSQNLRYVNSLFYGCSSLQKIDDIFNLDSENNITNISRIFYNCLLLKTLPDISKWNTNNVIDISFLFYGCSKLEYLSDISNWNISNVKDISGLFYGCSSLLSLPDISKWNTNNVNNMSGLFCACSSLNSLPDISKWNTNNVNNMSGLFYGCSSLLFLPDISKWNTNNVNNMSFKFSGSE